MTPLRESPPVAGAARPAKFTEQSFNYHKSCWPEGNRGARMTGSELNEPCDTG